MLRNDIGPAMTRSYFFPEHTTTVAWIVVFRSAKERRFLYIIDLMYRD